MRLKLPPGTTGFWNERGERICTGSMMGRRDVLPDDPQGMIKLRMVNLPFVDGCYDRGGAYWGSPANIYLAFTGFAVYSPATPGFELIPEFQVYVRANSRHEAKQKVRKELPNARFYR
jgi:hypothetical protein